jgi:hypothetical protein
MSVHPYNLFPCCKKCNNDVKGKKDPLSGYSLNQMYLPFQLFVTDEAELLFQDDEDGNEHAIFRPLDDDPEIKTRLEHIEYLFEIPSRWNALVPEFASIAISQLCARVEIYLEDGGELNEELIRRGIKRTINGLQNNWGRSNYLYPATQWLKYASEHKFPLLFKEVSRTIQSYV